MADLVNLPVVWVIVKTVGNKAWDLDEHVGLHGGNSTVLIRGCTKRRSESVRLTSPYLANAGRGDQQRDLGPEINWRAIDSPNAYHRRSVINMYWRLEDQGLFSEPNIRTITRRCMTPSMEAAYNFVSLEAQTRNPTRS